MINLQRPYPLIPLLLLALILLVTPAVSAQEDIGVEYLRYDVEITLHEEGDFTVREIQQLRFNDTFSEGFAEVPLDYLNEIQNIRVFGGLDVENLQPYTNSEFGPNSFTYEEEGDTLFVDWRYMSTNSGDELTFVVEYDVSGGLWVYPDQDTLEWRAVAADRSGLNVPASRVTVNVPFEVTANDLDHLAFGPQYTTEIVPLALGQQIIFEATEALPDGTAFQVLVDFPHGLVTAVPQSWQIAEDNATLQYRIPAIDVKMEVGGDGRLHISEEQQVVIDEGNMVEGFRAYTWLYLDGIKELIVSEGDTFYTYIEYPSALQCENCFTMTGSERPSSWVNINYYSGDVDINADRAGGGEVTWRFPTLVSGEATTFSLDYTAEGVISINDQYQQLNWAVLPGYDVPVEQATLTIQLPADLNPADVDVVGAAAQITDAGELRLTMDEPSSEWAVTLTMPPKATNATKPLWQDELEEALVRGAEIQAERAREALTLRSGGVLALVLAILGGLSAWYLKGSRKVREALGNYRTEPPSTLAPGLVAYLLDEKPSGRGVMASLLHLATLGLVQIDLQGQTVALKRLHEPRLPLDKAEVTTPVGEQVKVPTHIARLFNVLRVWLPMATAVPLDSLTPTLQNTLPAIYADMGAEMVDYVYSGPPIGRWARWRPAFVWGGMAVLLFMLLAQTQRFRVTFFPPFGFDIGTILFVFFGTAVGFMFLRGFFGRRVASVKAAGKKESQRWRGFKAYLQDIQTYGDLPEAQAVLDRYFDYAVALAVDERLLAQVQALGGVVPAWIGSGQADDGTAWQNSPVNGRSWYHRPWYRRGAWIPRPQKSATKARASTPQSATDQRPPLQRVSDQLSGSLALANQGMTRMLNSAADSNESVQVEIMAQGQKVKLEWEPGTPVDKMVGDIMSKSQSIRPPRTATSSGSGGGGFRGGGGSSGGSRSSRSSSRSSGSRRSGGGGRRGFR